MQSAAFTSIRGIKIFLARFRRHEAGEPRAALPKS